MELKEKIKNLPELPGIYKFISSDQRIIYVGKSKRLRSRVRSYFSGVKEGKIQRLVRQIADLEYELCDTHLEARLLECQRIKELQPVFNKQFKRERGFVYLKIGQHCREAPMSIVYTPDRGFGPFRNRRLLESVIESFQKLYPMRLADTGSAKTDGRQSQIEFTYYLLPQRISTETYFQNRKVMTRLFQEEDLWEAFLLDLEEAMMMAAEEEKFQAAIFYRDFLQALRLLKRMWFEDHRLFQELVFLKIPVSGGDKFFRIRDGCIELCQSASSSADDLFEAFMAASPETKPPDWAKFTIFEQYDFRDILYSEIRALPPDQIVRPAADQPPEEV